MLFLWACMCNTHDDVGASAEQLCADLRPQPTCRAVDENQFAVELQWLAVFKQGPSKQQEGPDGKEPVRASVQQPEQHLLESSRICASHALQGTASHARRLLAPACTDHARMPRDLTNERRDHLYPNFHATL